MKVAGASCSHGGGLGAGCSRHLGASPPAPIFFRVFRVLRGSPSSATPFRMRLLIVSQVYVPDPAAVGQHMASAAEALVERGHEVRVLTADRGYD